MREVKFKDFILSLPDEIKHRHVKKVRDRTFRKLAIQLAGNEMQLGIGALFTVVDELLHVVIEGIEKRDKDGKVEVIRDVEAWIDDLSEEDYKQVKDLILKTLNLTEEDVLDLVFEGAIQMESQKKS